jgi:anti-sigma factor RsiW
VTPARLPEADLQAYVDERLDAARRAAVESALAAHPQEAARIAAYRLLGERWRAAYASVLDEPIPEVLLAARKPRPRRPRRLLAGMLALAGGVVFAVVVGRSLAPAPIPEIVHRAAMAHTVYAAEVQHPVEARGEALDWLSERLKMRVQAPDLRSAGFTFLGGRLLPGDAAAAALLMYERQNGQRLTLYWAPEFRQARETGLVYAPGGHDTRVYYWLDEECGYALAAAELAREELFRLAQLAHEQLEK